MNFRKKRNAALNTCQRPRGRLLLPLAMAFLVASCSSLVSDYVNSSIEYEAYKGWNNMSKKNGDSPTNDKKKEKEKEQLKKQGKCQTCAGMGRTPDGKYVCPTCQGTGKAADHQ